MADEDDAGHEDHQCRDEERAEDPVEEVAEDEEGGEGVHAVNSGNGVRLAPRARLTINSLTVYAPEPNSVEGFGAFVADSH